MLGNRWELEFAPAHGSPASLSDHVLTSQNHLKVETPKARLLSMSLAKVPLVLTPEVFSFALHFHILVVWTIVVLFHTLLFCLTDFNWEDQAFRCCEYNDGKNCHRFFFQDTIDKSSV